MRIGTVVQNVGDAVAQVGFDEYGFAVEQIDLALKTTSVVEGGVKVDLEVLQVGAAVKSTDVRTVTLSLVPRRAPSLKAPDMAASLTAGVRDAAEAVAKASETLPDYGMKTATIEVAFSINASGGFEIVVKGGGEREWEQSLKLTLKRL